MSIIFNLKRILSAAAMALIAMTASAQFEPGFHSGFRAYGGFSNVTGKNYSKAFSYGIGYVPQYDFNKSVYIQTGIEIWCYQHKQLFKRKEISYQTTAKAAYIHIPVHFGYHYIIKESSFVFLQAGSTLAVGLGGTDHFYNSKSKYHFTNAAFEIVSDIEKLTSLVYCVEPRQYFKEANRFDIGIGGRLGVNIKGYEVSVGLNYGLLNVYDGANTHNFNINIGLGVRFY